MDGGHDDGCGEGWAAATAANQLAGAAVSPAPVRVAAPRGGVSPSVGAGAVCRAAGKGKEVLSGVVFQPFEEIKGELALVPQTPDKSLARQKFVDDCEAALNEQINVEYNDSEQRQGRLALRGAAPPLCLRGEGAGRPTTLGASCGNAMARWSLVSDSRLHVAVNATSSSSSAATAGVSDGDGLLCLDVGADGRRVVTNPCRCLSADNSCDPQASGSSS